MIKIENTDIYGWEAAIRGMRNPYESWDKSDSYWDKTPDTHNLKVADNLKKYGVVNIIPVDAFVIGPNDLKLMRSLAKAGNDHAKFARMINVTCDITAPQFKLLAISPVLLRQIAIRGDSLC